MPQRLHLAFKGYASEAKRLRNDVRVWLLNAGVNGTTGNDIVLAASEAFINAVEHPTNKASNTIEVTGDIDQHEVVLRVRDQGQWQEDIDPGRDHHGLHLMRRVMTEVTINHLPSGSVVTLRRTLY
jgi:anti-sigma regulatory factor (Ser/Thr protein kinase)